MRQGLTVCMKDVRPRDEEEEDSLEEEREFRPITSQPIFEPNGSADGNCGSFHGP